MNLEYKNLLPEDFADDSRVWMYQSSRLFLMNEALEIEDMLNEFVGNWKSHGAKVKGFATLLFGRFIILMADETSIGVGGCSTDSSVHVIKAVEQKFNAKMFERELLAFFVKDKIELLPLSQLNYAFKNNYISPDTLYFNNTVQTKTQLMNEWIIPLKNSWLDRKLKMFV